MYVMFCTRGGPIIEVGEREKGCTMREERARFIIAIKKGTRCKKAGRSHSKKKGNIV